MNNSSDAAPGTQVRSSGTTGSREATALVPKPRAQDHLPPEVRAEIEFRKAMNLVASEIANLSWGKGLDQGTRRAIAEWGRRFGVDVTTEVHLLGGRVYLNGAFYLRKLSEQIDDDRVEYARADHVNADPRLLDAGKAGLQEAARRLAERIRFNIPEEAKAAVVYRVRLKSMSEEVCGVKWTGGGTRKNDPVGDQFPVETAETRAARRCIRQIASHVPQLAGELERIETAAEQLEPAIERDKLEAKSQGLLGKSPLAADGYDGSVPEQPVFEPGDAAE